MRKDTATKDVIELDWIRVESRAGARRRVALIWLKGTSVALYPRWMLPDGVDISTVVEFIRERCPSFVRCRGAVTNRALIHEAIAEFNAATAEWKARATALRLAQLKADGWRLVRVTAQSSTVCLASPDGGYGDAPTQDSVVDVVPTDSAELMRASATGAGLDQHRFIHGAHGFDVSVGDALAVFCT